MEKFRILKDNTRKVRRFNLSGRTLEFKLKPIPKDANPIHWTKEAITQIVHKGVEGLSPQDMVGFSFCSKDFNKGEGWMRFKVASDVTVDDVWDTISSIYQSNACGLNTETFCLRVTSVRLPSGLGRERKYINFQEDCTARRGVVVINNNDGLCLPRAIVVAIAYVNHDNEYRQIRRNIGKKQEQKAIKLLRDSNIIIPKSGAGVSELQQFQEYLQPYKLTVYLYGSKGRDVMFEGDGTGKRLNLIYHDGHYNVVTSLTAAFTCTYYCEDCHVPFNNKNRHRCGGTCAFCFQTPVCSKEDVIKIKCGECGRDFRGQKCFDNHKTFNICTQIRRCEKCFTIYRCNRNHVCEEVFCKTCNSHVNRDHLCYIQVDKGSPKTQDTLFIFYDLETMQEQLLEDGSLLHQPNLCVFVQCCDKCIDEEKLYFCQKCGFRQKIITDNVINVLMRHILEIRKKFKNVVVLAHNGGGFDHQFILNHILTQTDLTPELIMRGTKLVCMFLDNVRFLDSLNYFQMSLNKLPKVFGLTALKKGYFPHLFNTTEHQNYIGPIPPIETFDPDNLKCNEREILLAWHASKVAGNYTFDFQKEFIDYCVADVDILARSCLKFRELMIKEGNVCPFTESVTLPGACNKIFRRSFLKPNTIGLIPKGGYRNCDNQSKLAIRWLLLEERSRQIDIIHSGKQKEARVGGVKVDGYCPKTNEVFEFHGCYYHGCPKCFKYTRNASLPDSPSETLEYRYEATVAKSCRLIELGYAVIEMWECDFKRLMTEEMFNYTETHHIIASSPLNPRDAFYGGRTGNAKSFYITKGDEQIKYVDFTSLYPYVNKYGLYPIRHPTVHIGESCSKLNLDEVDGIIKCKILPPQTLFHPVLPVKMNKKLMFVLCRSCGEGFDQGPCKHNDDERAVTGTWVLAEVKKAIQKGYKLLVTYEIWKYDTEQYNKSTKTGGLFNEYINKFLGIKQQSSGWPTSCDTSEKRAEYVKDYFETEGVRLDPAKIDKNPGLRQLGKSVITSFWGKLGQRENQSKTTIVRQPGEFYNIMTNPSIDINSVLTINEDTLLVNWGFKEESYNPLSTVNVVLAAYTTAQARLKLYEYLEKLEDRVLYYDTDSIIYVSVPGMYDPPLGRFLGELTDELEEEGVGSYIKEFVSGGPKNYAYKMWSSSKGCDVTVCKVKGISLSYKASQVINFDQIKKMVLEEESEPIMLTSKLIKRTAEHDVITTSAAKTYRTNSTKRCFAPDGSSTPYGYKKARLTNVIIENL
uniref:DNA-directed DNA polymerase n=1 Tax=Photinus pyralis TaxID=7054 RepID=A0A1Y1L1R3_PHOPY